MKQRASCLQLADKHTLTLLGISSNDWPFFASPASTFPMTTIPMSLYLSTTGITNGPPILRLSDGRLSMKGINASPLDTKHMYQLNSIFNTGWRGAD